MILYNKGEVYWSHVMRTPASVKFLNELRREKTHVLVSDLVRHKTGCTATGDGYRLEILDLESRGIVLSL